MSANNWAICPRCRDNAKAKANMAFKRAAAYGNVTAEEYAELQREAQTLAVMSVEATFREDYEFYGASEGTITASYGGHCQKCGLTGRFKHEHKFYVEGD